MKTIRAVKVTGTLVCGKVVLLVWKKDKVPVLMKPVGRYLKAA